MPSDESEVLAENEAFYEAFRRGDADAVDADGAPIVYNQPYPYMPDFVICRTELREDMLASLAEIW